MKNKETRLLLKIVMCGLGGIVWIVDCAKAMSRGRQGLGLLLFIIAAVFTAAFIITLRRYLGGRAAENKE